MTTSLMEPPARRPATRPVWRPLGSAVTVLVLLVSCSWLLDSSSILAVPAGKLGPPVHGSAGPFLSNSGLWG